MSRFWAAASSSEGEQGSDSDSYDEAQPTQKLAEKKFGATFEESDSDSEDEVRVVKSQKDRKWDSIQEGIVRIRNARKNSDWPLIQDEFANVNKMIEKSKMLILQSGLPPFYVKMLMEVEDHVQLALKDKDAIKKMKPVVSRALNQMKLQVRKHNENYKDDIADCRANPDKYAEVEEEESSSSSESDSDSDSDDSDSDSDSDASSESEKPAPKAKPAAKPVAKKAAAAESDSEDDSLFGGNDDDSSSSSESEDDGRKELKGRARWLKKAPTEASKKKEVFEKKERAVVKKKEYEPVARRTVSSYAEVKLTEEELDKKVGEMMAARGKKNTDPREVLRQLEVLTKAARLHGPRKEIPVLMHLISNMLDSQRSIDDYLEHQQWRTCYRSLYRVVSLMEANKKLSFAAVTAEDAEQALAAHLKATTLEETVAPTDPNVLKVVGSIVSFIVRLQDEYTKSLQQINPHTKEYVLRLSDEASLVELAEVVLSYYLRTGDSKSAASVSQLIVDHMYYKHDVHAVAVRRAHLFNKTWGKYSDLHPACVGKFATPLGANKAFPSASEINPAAFLGNPTVNPPPFNPGQRLLELCTYIFKYGDKRIKTHALLALVHHHALHDRYYKARDLLLISHIQDFADKFDVKTQILYNRAIVTLGLCAFRLGLYQKAHDCLTGICSGRVKELLAQGQMRWVDKDPEQEKVERRRQMPFHMHINPDLLELCHLTSAMILELPHLARSTSGAAATHQNVISRQFRKYLNGYSKQVFRGPPENTREHVLAATKALLSGEWQKAVDLLMGLEVWKLIPNDGAESAKVLLRARLQEEAVRTFLLLNGDHYESLSLAYLCEMFGMDEVITRRIISRMIFNREISAAWEASTNILVMYKTEPSTLQTLSQGLAEKLSLLLESNERILDPIAGVYGFKDKDEWKGDNRKYDQNRNAGGSGGGKFRSGGNYKSGSRPVVGGRQQQQQPYNKQGGNKNRTGGASAGGNAQQTPNKNAWSGSRPNKPRTDAPPQQAQAPKKWGQA